MKTIPVFENSQNKSVIYCTLWICLLFCNHVNIFFFLLFKRQSCIIDIILRQLIPTIMKIVVPIKGTGFEIHLRVYLLGRGVFCYSLSTFTHSMLSQLSWKQETDSSLDFPRCNCGSLIVVSQTGSFCSDSFKDVVDERIHDAHSF